MTIRHGEAWGESVPSPDGLHLAASDAEAGGLIARAHGLHTELPTLGLAAGDLARTMGGGTPGRFPGEVVRAPVDVLRVEARGQTTWAVAHVVAGPPWWRGGWWRGEVLLAMNAQFLGRYDVAPRSHPNDGKVDVLRVDARMTVRERLQARARARSGTHVPHPRLQSTQVPTATVQFTRPLVIRVDGGRWLTADSVTITVEPDALIAHA